MRIVVIGAGLGGVAAAVGLHRTGHEVTLLERAPEPRETGTGIVVMPNGLRALDELGLGAEVRRHAVTTRTGGLLDRRGRPLLITDVALARRQMDLPAIIDRTELHRLLRAPLPATTLRTSTPVERLRPGPHGVTVIGEHGPVAEADAVIAADGIGSRLRRALFPAHPGLRRTGRLDLRGMLPRPAPPSPARPMDRDSAPPPTDQPIVRPGTPAHAATPPPGHLHGAPDRYSADHSDLPTGQFIDWRSGLMFGLFPIGDDLLYWFTDSPLHGEPPAPAEARRQMLAQMSDWHPLVRELIEATPPEAIHVDPITGLAAPLPSYAVGRVALLGDAAHAMPPDLGQGAAQAFQDAAALTRHLSGAAPEQAAERLLRYDAERRPAANRMMRAAHRQSRLTSRTGVPAFLRDTLLRAVPSRLATRALATIWQA